MPTVVFSSLPLGPTIYLIGLRPFNYIFDGEIFSAAFDPIHAGGAMDQPMERPSGVSSV